MSEATETPESTCAVCRRTLLLGERSLRYLNREGAELVVCELCKPRAEAAGWLKPDQVAAPVAATGARRHRGRSGGELLGSVIGGLGRRRGGQRPPRRARPQRPEDEPAPEAGPDRRPADPADVRAALEAFNASAGPRTITGLARSLGRPQATVVAVRAPGGGAGARLTVAWDLAWYQWEIREGKRGPEVRRSGTGEGAEQLRAADRNWNLAIAEDGTLARRRRTRG
jgi:hypothetical protein